MLGGAVAAAAVVAVVLIVVATSGSSEPAATTTTAANGGSDVGPSGPVALFAGIPQNGDTLGRAGAPASMLVFEDPQCPYCQQWNNDTLPAVVDQFVRTGKLKLVYRGIAIIGPNSVKGLRAVFAAGHQDKLWNFSDAMYEMQGAENSGWITNQAILSAARASGANGAAILAASPSKAVTAQLQLAATEAQTYQVRGTPTFVIEKPPALPQQLSVSSLEPGAFTAELQSALQ